MLGDIPQTRQIREQQIGAFVCRHAPRETEDGHLGIEDHAGHGAPSWLRSVYGAFGQSNHRNFHGADGSGYELLADRIIVLDGSNPQMAARLLTPLSRWRRYDSRRQGLMRAALGRIAAQSSLSKDVFEIVTKSLADEQ